MDNLKNKSIILFDGVCNLCNSAVNFIIKHEKNEHYLFASLQSDAAKEILLQFELKNLKLDSIILIEKGEIYYKSTAVLLISKQLSNGLQYFYCFIIIPKFIRDALYTFVANNRYNWFGKRNSCMLPNKKTKNRFL